MLSIWLSIFFFKKIEGPFDYFYKDNLDILKTYEGAGRGY